MDAKQQEARVEHIKCGCAKMKKHQRAHKSEFLPVDLGTDKNKADCKRGKTAIAFRYCSFFIRQFFESYLLGDNEQSDWCVLGRDKTNCCFMDLSKSHKFAQFNIAEALQYSVTGNSQIGTNENGVNLLLNALTNKVIGMSYPSKQDNTKLQVHVNGKLWVEYYLKMSTQSTIQKTAAPSGYKYKDRVSFGTTAIIQGNGNKDLVLFITQDKSKKIHDKREPVVNGVGFWNLTEIGGIRNIIHLNARHCAKLAMGFYVKPNALDNIENIEIKIVPSDECFNGPFTIWSYSSNNTKHSVSKPIPMAALSPSNSPQSPSDTLVDLPMPQLPNGHYNYPMTMLSPSNSPQSPNNESASTLYYEMDSSSSTNSNSPIPQLRLPFIPPIMAQLPNYGNVAIPNGNNNRVTEQQTDNNNNNIFTIGNEMQMLQNGFEDTHSPDLHSQQIGCDGSVPPMNTYLCEPLELPHDAHSYYSHLQNTRAPQHAYNDDNLTQNGYAATTSSYRSRNFRVDPMGGTLTFNTNH